MEYAVPCQRETTKLMEGEGREFATKLYLNATKVAKCVALLRSSNQRIKLSYVERMRKYGSIDYNVCANVSNK